MQHGNQDKEKIIRLIGKGVTIPNPESVEIGQDVDIERISGEGVIIHSGSKIFGQSTLILQNSVLGHEGPVTIENCQLGPSVNLKSGYFKEAVFLKNVSMGYGAHVREGTILEEQASVAHTVALKQTILFPFVTLGSLINFCDCLMAGGTSRKNHSEVGSSFIHFNFTPNQDKATASLIGDVPCGVMLNQNPVFLGGQGGIVGPVRLAFGTITAAGTITRKDELRPDRLILEVPKKSVNIPYKSGSYPTLKKIINNNIIYIANLIALGQWYKHVRSVFMSPDFPEPLLQGLRARLNQGITERIKRLKELGEKANNNLKSKEKSVVLYAKWPEIGNTLLSLKESDGDPQIRDAFLTIIEKGIQASGKEYISVIQHLNKDDADTGTKWMQGIVDTVTDRLSAIIK